MQRTHLFLATSGTTSCETALLLVHTYLSTYTLTLALKPLIVSLALMVCLTCALAYWA